MSTAVAARRLAFAVGLLAVACGGAPGKTTATTPAHALRPPAPSTETPRPAPTRLVGHDPPAAMALSPRASLPMTPGATTYDLELALDDGALALEGREVVRFTNRTGAPLTTVPLLLHPNGPREAGEAGAASMRVISVSLLGEGGPARPLLLASPRPTLVNVRLPSPVAAGGVVRLEVRFDGRLRRLPAGANDMLTQALGSLGALAGGNHSADYGLLAEGDGILTVASAYPMVAPFREGAFDTTPPPRLGDVAYNDVAAFRVTTKVPVGLHVLTNLVDAPPVAQGARESTTSSGTFVRDLVLVAGRDLVTRRARVGDVTVTSTFRGHDGRAGQTVLEVGAAALASMEKRFGPYPWPELHLAEATLVGGAGGVEFCGMALVAAMFYQPPNLSPAGLGGGALGQLLGEGLGEGGESNLADAGAAALEDQLAFVVAHEVAHQYFAGVVGSDSRRHAAVDEPLAQFAAALAVADRRGRAAAEDALTRHAKTSYALHRALGGADGAAARPSAAFTSPAEYAGLVYGKAPYGYVALQKRLGEGAFDAALREAVAQSRFRMVTLDQWMSTVEGAVDTSQRGVVRDVLTRYLKGVHGDGDLAIGDPAEMVLRTMLPPELASGLTEGMAAMGLKPKDLVPMLLGGP